jgi:hypothetical protein
VTIVPGWYPGRAPHIHVRVHVGGIADGRRYRRGHISHTGQIFLPPDITDAAYRLPAYATPVRTRITLQGDDIFIEGGRQLARVMMIDPARPALGYVSESLIVIDPATTPRS